MTTVYELLYGGKDMTTAARVFSRIFAEVLTCFPLGLAIRPMVIQDDGCLEKKMTPRHQRATSMLVRLLQEKAPPKPACFRSQEDWVRYLHQAEASGEMRVLLYAGRTGPGEANRGRIKTDQINPQIDFCQDCTHQRHVEMKTEGRCRPPSWGTVPARLKALTKVDASPCVDVMQTASFDMPRVMASRAAPTTDIEVRRPVLKIAE